MSDLPEIKIEKNVPMPEKKKEDPLGLQILEVGDSFVLPVKFQSRFQYYRNKYQRKNPGCRLTTRTISDYEFRVWRVE